MTNRNEPTQDTTPGPASTTDPATKRFTRQQLDSATVFLVVLLPVLVIGMSNGAQWMRFASAAVLVVWAVAMIWIVVARGRRR